MSRHVLLHCEKRKLKGVKSSFWQDFSKKSEKNNHEKVCLHINQSYVSILHLGTNNLRYNGEPFDILHYYEEIVQYANTIQNAHIILTGKNTSNVS